MLMELPVDWRVRVRVGDLLLVQLESCEAAAHATFMKQ